MRTPGRAVTTKTTEEKVSVALQNENYKKQISVAETQTESKCIENVQAQSMGTHTVNMIKANTMDVGVMTKAVHMCNASTV